MAWRSHGTTNAELIQALRKNSLIKSDRLQEAMAKVDRANYVLHKSSAYQDSPQSIGYGATITAPHMHANALENLIDFIVPGARILDVGSGSGYLLACFHHLLNPTSQTSLSSHPSTVIGIEHISGLARRSKQSLIDDGLEDALKNESVKVIEGDGRNPDPTLGGNWNVIHVGAAPPEMPESLVDQLASPGRMFIPVGVDNQVIFQVDKDADGQVTTKELYRVRYVPLTSAEKQWKR